MIGQNDEEVTSPKSILNEIKSFYSNFYSRKSDKTEQECFEYLASINMPKLSESEREECEGMQKSWEAIQSMKNGKSPGNYGLTKEFYVCFLRRLHLLSLNH